MITHKRKTLGLGIITMLICLSLMGVGFSAWIVTTESVAKNTGNLTAFVAEQKGCSVTTEWVDSVGVANGNTTPEIVFGKDEIREANPNDWLTAKGISNEKLNAVLKVTVSKTASEKVKVALSVNEVVNSVATSITDTSSSKINALIKSGALAYPKVEARMKTFDGSDNRAITLEDGKNEYEIILDAGSATEIIYINVNFKWGTMTKKGQYTLNPFKYFNELSNGKDTVLEKAYQPVGTHESLTKAGPAAVAMMNDIYKAIEGEAGSSDDMAFQISLRGEVVVA